MGKSTSCSILLMMNKLVRLPDHNDAILLYLQLIQCLSYFLNRADAVTGPTTLDISFACLQAHLYR